MAGIRLSERFITVANLFIVPFMGGLIASIVARNTVNGFWPELAVSAGVFAIYLVIVGLLKRAWVRRDLIVPFMGGLIAIIVARNAVNGFWQELAVFAGVLVIYLVIYLVIVGLWKCAWVRRSPN
jgi:hypothetical protein